MNPVKFLPRFSLILVSMFLISSSLFAQRHRHYYYHERIVPHYYYSRPVVTLGLGISGYRYYPYYYSPAYRYYPYGPAIGFRISTLPFGFRSIYVGPSLFYYYNGIYYRPYGSDQYEVAAPPMGAKVPELPEGAKTVVIDGQKYYEYGGTYYKEEITSDNEISYTVVGINGKLNTTDNSQQNSDQNLNSNQIQNQNQNQNEGSTPNSVDKLPDGCKTVVINQQKYYVSPSGVYYQEVIQENKVHYEVVGKLSGNN